MITSTRRGVPMAPILLVLALAYGDAQPEETDRRQPNIMYIMPDDHAVRTISAYDQNITRTTDVDRIADEGAIFTQSLVANSICGPSRASILTGKHSHKHGVTGNGEPRDRTQMVFPRALKQAGYQTALIGKWPLNNRLAYEDDTYKILTGAGRPPCLRIRDCHPKERVRAIEAAARRTGGNLRAAVQNRPALNAVRGVITR